MSQIYGPNELLSLLSAASTFEELKALAANAIQPEERADQGDTAGAPGEGEGE